MSKTRDIVDAIDSTGKTADKLFTSQEEYNKSIVDRYKADMSSDSWLTKNVRPAILVVLLVLWTYITLSEIELPKSTIISLESMTNTAFIFYFASRGGEKIMQQAGKRTFKLIKRRK